MKSRTVLTLTLVAFLINSSSTDTSTDPTTGIQSTIHVWTTTDSPSIDHRFDGCNYDRVCLVAQSCIKRVGIYEVLSPVTPGVNITTDCSLGLVFRQFTVSNVSVEFWSTVPGATEVTLTLNNNSMSLSCESLNCSKNIRDLGLDKRMSLASGNKSASIVENIPHLLRKLPKRCPYGLIKLTDNCVDKDDPSKCSKPIRMIIARCGEGQGPMEVSVDFDRGTGHFELVPGGIFECLHDDIWTGQKLKVTPTLRCAFANEEHQATESWSWDYFIRTYCWWLTDPKFCLPIIALPFIVFAAICLIKYWLRRRDKKFVMFYVSSDPIVMTEQDDGSFEGEKLIENNSLDSHEYTVSYFPAGFFFVTASIDCMDYKLQKAELAKGESKTIKFRLKSRMSDGFLPEEIVIEVKSWRKGTAEYKRNDVKVILKRKEEESSSSTSSDNVA